MESSFYFPPEYLRAGLLVSLLSVWLLVGLFAYLNHYTKQRYFTIWTTAWLFYALWLTLNFKQEAQLNGPFVQMVRQWCVGVSALFVFHGTLVFMGQKTQIRQTLLGLLIIFLLVWSYVGVYHVENPLQATLPIFTMLGLASIRAAYCFLSYRRRTQHIGASLLSVGLFLWGIYLGGYPFWEAQKYLQAVSFFICGVIQLFIAVSMIILVLEEARARHNRLLEIRRNSEEACVGLQHQVRSTEDRYRRLFEQASDGIVITNTLPELGIVELNQRARRLLLLPQFDPGKHSLLVFVEGNPAGGEASRRAQSVEDIRAQRTLELVATDGTRTPVEAEVSSTEFEGKPAYQFALREITERVRLEQQLRQSEKLSALGQMISGVAHELNNPLASIKSYVDWILSHHELSEETRQDLEKVAEESSRAAKLVGHFLSFARQQASCRSGTNLSQIVERVMELRRNDLSAHHIAHSLNLATDVPLVPTDQDKIQQALVNLINNAMQALAGVSPPGQIRVSTSRADDFIRICVEDNGPGVPKHLETRIFEPFFTTQEVGKGIGLGLSIAHSIVAEHNGRLYCQASSLGGACFVLELPLDEAKTGSAPLEQPSDTSIPKPERQPVVRSANILILDDEMVLADMLGRIVEHLGHRATLCYAPLAALEQIEKQDFDLVLSDYRMPGLDGQQFYRRAVQIKPGLASRIIFLTGDASHEETQGFLDSIGNTYISKPFQLLVVESTVTRVLQELEDSARTKAEEAH